MSHVRCVSRKREDRQPHLRVLWSRHAEASVGVAGAPAPREGRTPRMLGAHGKRASRVLTGAGSRVLPVLPKTKNNNSTYRISASFTTLGGTDRCLRRTEAAVSSAEAHVRHVAEFGWKTKKEMPSARLGEHTAHLSPFGQRPHAMRDPQSAARTSQSHRGAVLTSRCVSLGCRSSLDTVGEPVFTEQQVASTPRPPS